MFEFESIDWCGDEAERCRVHMLNDFDVLVPTFNRIDELLKRGHLDNKSGVTSCGGVKQLSEL